MATSFWKLTPHMHPDHVAQADEVRAEEKKLREELRSFGLLPSLFWPPVWDRKTRIKSRLRKLERWFEAAMAPIGLEFDPPCIGTDEKATAWYRKHLAEDPEAWPLSPEEMVEEMTGNPVWEFCDEPLLQQLDVGWVSTVMPIPPGPGLSASLQGQLDRNLSATEALEAADKLQDALAVYFNSTYPDLLRVTGGVLSGETANPEALRKVLANETPAERERREGDSKAAHETTIAIAWLRLWGEKDYGFTRGEQSG